MADLKTLSDRQLAERGAGYNHSAPEKALIENEWRRRQAEADYQRQKKLVCLSGGLGIVGTLVGVLLGYWLG